MTSIKNMLPPSIRLNLMVICETVLLLSLALGVLLFFSHQTLKQEAIQDAEETLDGTVQHIDNILLSIEQTTENVYADLLQHIDDPDRMLTYSRRPIFTVRIQDL